MKKVILILVDGLRPDAMLESGHPYLNKLLAQSSYTLEAQTVFPSVTLPCHMSLFHSVDPSRHGVTTNTFTPQVRPINGLCEQLHSAGKTCAFFYNWSELRDLARPGSLSYSNYVSGYQFTYEKANDLVCKNAIQHIKTYAPDFSFIYLGWVDEAGHADGWMSKEYMRAVYASFDCIEKIMNCFSAEYTTIITADHGGHERMHGTQDPEDMTIPIIFHGPDFEQGERLNGIDIKCIAPTITQILNCAKAPEWEGNSIL